MENSLQTLNATKNLEEWSVKVKECRTSGLTVREWCKSQGIRTQKFYYWQKKLFTVLAPEQNTNFAEITIHEDESPTFSPATIAKVSVSGLEVEILNTATEKQLTTLLAALKKC